MNDYPPGSPPCNGCVRCCLGDAVRILPYEDASQWETEAHPYHPGARMLAHASDGACIYLGINGCTRYRDRPQQCRDMDCRVLARGITRTRARRLDRVGALRLEVWKRGRELLREAPMGR